MSREFDPNTVTFKEKEGVHIYPKKWGSPETFMYIDPGLHVGPSVYFQPMVSYLQAKGYQIGKDLFGAPYDFRDSGIDNDTFMTDFKLLIEQAYDQNNEKVTFVTHSMGGKMVLHFLDKKVDESWKKKYIDKWIAYSPAFLGSA